MEQIVRLIIAAVSVIAFVYSFYKCSGSLSVRKLNINSLTFYYLLVYCVIGGTLVFLGFRNHYMISLINNEDVVDYAYLILIYAVVVLPLTQYLINRLFGINDYGSFYSRYIQSDMDLTNKNNIFTVTVILSIIGIGACIYTFYHIGYVAFFEILKGNNSLIAERQEITKAFTGNVLVRNLLALGMVPLLSFLSYICWRATKEKKWLILFGIMFFFSVLCKTYNFEKSPVIIYIGYFYIIEIMMGNAKNLLKPMLFIAFGGVLMFLIYVYILDYSGKILSLTNGPLSRLLISQIGSLFLHVQLFPKSVPFLAGSSFPKAVSWVFGSLEAGVRSGRVVMEHYFPHSVAAGTAGVMNTIFIAEAYANFGVIGVLTAPVLVAFFMSVLPNIILMQNKDPINITIYLVLLQAYTTAIVGGFTDFIYNIHIVFMVSVFLLAKAFIQNGKLKIRVSMKS